MSKERALEFFTTPSCLDWLRTMQFTSANFQLFFENAADLLFIASPQGQVLACNRIFRETIGCENVGVGGLANESKYSLDELFDRPNWPSVAQDANAGPTAESFFDLRTMSGNTVAVKGKVFVDDDSSHLCGLFRASSLKSEAIAARNPGPSIATSSLDKSAAIGDSSEFGRRTSGRALIESLVRLHEQELQGLAGRIHDSFVQDVVGAQMWLESVKEGLTSADDATLDSLETAQKSLLAALRSARVAIGELRPSSNQSGNLQQELTGMVDEIQRQTDASISLTIPSPLGGLDPLTATVALRIVQQALQNAVHHGQPTRIDICARCDGDDFVLSVDDDGAGFDPHAKSDKLGGVRGMKDRARVLGGELTVSSQAGQGTRVLLRFPYPGPFSASNAR